MKNLTIISVRLFLSNVSTTKGKEFLTLTHLSKGGFKYITSGSGLCYHKPLPPGNPLLIQGYSITSAREYYPNYRNNLLCGRGRRGWVGERGERGTVNSCTSLPSTDVRSFSRERSLTVTTVELGREDRRSFKDNEFGKTNTIKQFRRVQPIL